MLVGDAGGMVDTVALKGVHHCIQSGILAAEAIYSALKAGDTDFSSYEQAVEDSSIGQELYEVRNTRQPFQKGFIKGGPLVNLAIATKGKLPPGRLEWHRNDAKPLFIGKTRDNYPKPDGKYTFDKLSSVYITGNATRDDAPNHIRVHKNVPREIAEGWRWMCPAGVYEVPEDAPGDGRRRRDRQLHELRAVRGDHGQGRAPDPARGRRRAALPDHLSASNTVQSGRERVDGPATSGVITCTVSR